MDIQEMLDKIVLNERDESIPEFDRLRRFYEGKVGGSGCSACRMRRIKNSLSEELEKAIKETSPPHPES